MKAFLICLLLSAFALCGCTRPPRERDRGPDPMAPGEEAALRYSIWVLGLPAGQKLGPDGRLPAE